jgi:hypothetical protein
MLTRIPKPSEQEVADRAERTPMNQADRIHLVKQLWPGIFTISILYLFASLLRGMRSDFAPEIWKYLGFKSLPETYSQTEIWVTIGILAINGSLVLIRSNYRAFFTSILAIATGFLLLIIAGFWGIESMGPFWLIVLTGFGIYLPYLTITTSVFERMIAITRHKANIGFLMYIVDSVGYLGYNVLLLSIGFIFPNLDIPELFFAWVKLLGIAGMALCLISSAYFIRKLKQ